MSDVRKLLEELKAIEDQHHLLAEPEKAATAKLREITTSLVAAAEELVARVKALEEGVAADVGEELKKALDDGLAKVSEVLDVFDSRIKAIESVAAAPKGADNSGEPKGPEAPAAAEAPAAGLAA